MYITLIQNAALLLALTAIYGLLARVRRLNETWLKILSGLLFGAVAIAGMNMPFHYIPGIIYDGRSIILSMAGLFGGGISVAISTVVAGLYRAYIGGSGVWAGTATIVCSAIIGLIFRRVYDNQPEKLDIFSLYGFGIIVHIVMLGCQLLLLPGSNGITVVSIIWLPIMLIFPLATVLMAFLLGTEKRRLQVEYRLRDSEEDYRKLFEDHSAVKLIIDPETNKIIDANHAAAAFYGWSRDTLKQMSIEQINILPLEEIRKEMEKVKTSNRLHFEFRHRLANGSIKDVEVFSSKVRMKGGDYLHSIIHDITERKQAEEKLRQSEERMRAIVEGTPNLFFYTQDSEANLTYISPTVEQITGYNVENWLKRKDWFTTESPLNQIAKEKTRAHLKGVFTQERTHLEIRHANGNLIMIEAFEYPVLRDGKIIGLQGVAYDITERRHMEEALRESEEKFRMVFKNVFDGISIYEEDIDLSKRRLIDCNDRYADMSGRSREELIKCGSTKDLQTQFEETADDVRLDSLEKGIPFRGSFSWVRPDGKDNIVEYVGVPVVWRGKAYSIGIDRDMTERKRAEEKLSELQALYHSLVEQLPAGVFRKDLEGRYIYVSSWFCQLKKMKAEEFLGKTPHQVSANEEAKHNVSDLAVKYAAEGEDHHQLILKTGNAIESDEEYINLDGTKQYIHAIKMPVIGPEKKVIGTQGLLFDVTALHQAEENVRKLSSAVEQSGSSIIITDVKGKIEYANPKFVEVSGYSAQEVLEKNPRILKSGFTSSEEYKNMWNSIMDGKVWHGEFQNRKKNGELYWESATISPIKDARGRITHFISINDDITQQKILAEQLRQMQKLESLGTLAGGIAHDFNNILGIILAYASSIKQFKYDNRKFDLATDTIMKAVDRGKTLVTQILTFARKSDVEFGPVDVNEVVTEIMAMIQETFPKILTFSNNLDKDITLIHADRSQVHQVVLNLCVNARDAMPKGGLLTINTKIVPGLALRAQHPEAHLNNYFCIEVTDTGEGMSEEVRGKIFEPFFTTKEKGRGTGLGLAVVFGVVQTHKGFIDVESEVRKGTTFRVYLPAFTLIEPTEKRIEETKDEIPGGDETILVVEDEKHLLEPLISELTEKGYRVLDAEDGLEAIGIYEEHQKEISLILTDYGLPIMSGLEMSKKIKRLNPKAKIIVATGYLDPNMKTEFLEENVHRFLFKPYDIKKVLKEIRKFLDED